MQNEVSKILSQISCQRIAEDLAPNCELLSSECRPVNDASGFVGDFYNLTLTVACGNETRELHFFVKSISSDPGKKEFALRSGALFKEERMFGEIIPQLSRNGIDSIFQAVPRCFQIQPSNLIVFEDLRVAGYKTLNNRVSLSLNCIKLTLDSLAELHSSIFVLEELLNYSVTQDYKKEFQETFFIPGNEESESPVIRSASRGLITQINLLWSKAADKFSERIKEVLADFHIFAQPSTRFRNTLCHGDLWIKNLMFRFEDDIPKHCMVVDFQSYRYSPPAQDVMAFIYLTTDRSFRKEHLQDVLDHYYRKMTNALTRYGICVNDILSYEDYEESCNYYKKFAIAQAATHSHLTILTSDAMELFGSTPGYKDNFFLVDRSDHIVKWCETDSVFRQKMIECLKDLQEILNI